MNVRARLVPRLIFLTQAGLLPYLGLGLAIACAAAGDSPLEWAFYASAGGASLVGALWLAFRLDPATRVGRVVYAVTDVLALGVAGLWAWLTRGTVWYLQFGWAILSLGLAGASLWLLFSRAGAGAAKRGGDAAAPKRRAAALDLVALILCLGLGLNAAFAFGGYGRSIEVPASQAPMRVSYWTWSWNAADYGEELLGKLAASGSALHMFISPELIAERGPELEASFREFARRGIDVWPTTGIPDPAAYRKNILSIADWVREKGLSAVKGFTADIEWPGSTIEPYKKAEAEGDIIGSLRALLATSNDERTRRAEALEYQAAIDGLHERGFPAALVGMYWELDDEPDGDDAVQRLMSFSAIPPAWDVYDYMIYRHDSGFARSSPYFTWFYLNEMAKRFEPGAWSVSLGVAGGPPLDTLSGLLDDLAIAQSLGAGEAIVFILDRGGSFPNAYPEGLAAFDLIAESLAKGRALRIPYTRSLFMENMQVRLLDMLLF